MVTFKDAMKNSVADTMDLRPEQLHPEWFDENGGFIKNPLPDYKITLPDNLKPDVPRKIGPDFIGEPRFNDPGFKVEGPFREPILNDPGLNGPDKPEVPSGIIGPDGRPIDIDPGISVPISDDPGFKIGGPSREPIFNDPGFKIDGPSREPVFNDPGFRIGGGPFKNHPILNDPGLNGPGFGDKGEPIGIQPAGINPDNLKDVLEKVEARRKALENADHIPDSQAREAYKQSILSGSFDASATAVAGSSVESRYDINPRNPENQLKDTVEIDQTVHADLHADIAEAVEVETVGKNHRKVKTLEYKEPANTLPIVNKPETPSGMIGRDGKPVENEAHHLGTSAEDRAKMAEAFLESGSIAARGAEGPSVQAGE